MATRIPITKDAYNFEDRQKKIWEDMERDMERRRREWEEEIDKMRQEFFHLRPENTEFAGLGGTGTLARLPARVPGMISDTDDGTPVIEKDEKGQPVFKVRFNMKDYNPEEMNVKMDSTKIMVSAKHEEKGEASTVSREYNREVNIPRDVDPLALQCTLNPDGYLVVHAPLPAPSYIALKDSSSATHSPSTVVKSSSSYQTSLKEPSKTQSTYAAGSAFSQQPQQQQLHTHAVNQPQQQQVHTHAVNQPQQQQVHTHAVNQPQQQQVHTHAVNQPQQQQVHTHAVNQPQQQQVHTHAINQPQQQQVHTHALNQPQQQQVHTHAVNQQQAPQSNRNRPPATFIQSTYNHEETLNHPDHVVPSYKPPPDLSKLGMLDSVQSRNIGQSYQSSPSSLLQNSIFPKRPPFSSLTSPFASDPLIPEPSTPKQLNTPTITSHDGKFQLTMPIDDYRPDELTVKTQDKKVVICARREISSGNRARTMEMSREHSLPDNVDPLTVKAFFTDTNNLIIEAPFIRN